ncbi:hypothetical protein OED01_12640 [Microbacterium sp. M28]|uniref:hypothetical protein n=1 Tax=Microbacterium sp. M28 TaxID=2962064 RepID=UPI0021F491D8|nr:hypothetical protein [Microbacterium sp. M28]UYO96442.1 hypothetical protein OED01_12640 [Microbacterium sp. M28]
MTRLPQTIDVNGVALQRLDAPEDIACWSGAFDGGEITLLIEPAGEPSAQALDAAEGAITEFDDLRAAAATFLLTELASDSWGLAADQRALLAQRPAPFDAPEVVVWQDGTWMIRFAESPLEIAEDYGIGVLFAGRVPVSIEDLSDTDEV